jgi:DNA polymerase
LQFLYFDAETFYTDEYSLRRMTTVEYIMDPRFEMLGASVAYDDETPRWVSAKNMTAFLASVDWQQVALVSHNTQFDGGVLAFRYGCIPRLYCDTLSMCRALLQHKLRSLALKAVAEFLNLGVKGDTIHQMKGVTARHLEESPAFHKEVAAYANNDNELCRGIFEHLKPIFPKEEFAVVDMVMRMFCEPRIQLDVGQLSVHLQTVRARKRALLDRMGFDDASTLMSNDQFALELTKRGVEPPTKISATTGKTSWAFAKTDPGLKDLTEHDDPDVQALIAARLGHKSTLEETRTEKLIRIGARSQGWRDRAAWCPMPLRYSGAHTHRLSGSDGLNVQNFPRGGTIRKALKAPPGYKFVAPDLSQIEARIVCWLAGAKMLDVFRRGEDPYRYQAIQIGALKPDWGKEHPEFANGRQLGKGLVLGCGFGMGPPKFQLTVAKPPYNMQLTLGEAQTAVYGYRNSNPEIVALWKILQGALDKLARHSAGSRSGTRAEITHGMAYEVDGDTVQLLLPSGLHLKYEGLCHAGNGLNFTYAGRLQYVYGGKATENLVQALARCVIMDAAVRVKREVNIWPALQVHDENVYLVPEDKVDLWKPIIRSAMTASPDWAPDLPVETSISIADTYGDAK